MTRFRHVVLPASLAAVLLLAGGLWWALALFAWSSWVRRFESSAAREVRLKAHQEGKGGSGLEDIIGFGIPATFSIGLSIDGLVGHWAFYSPTFSFFPPGAEVFQAVGAALMFIALLLFTSGAYLTGKYVFSKVREERTLLRTGPYRFIRHPIYLGFGLLAVGFILLSLNVFALPCLVLFIGWGWREEEKELAKLYGKEYAEYRNRTGALFPRIRKRP